MNMETDMQAIWNGPGYSIKHDMDIDVYFDEWRRSYVAHDYNEDGEDCCLVGTGRTKAEAIQDLVWQWEERHEAHERRTNKD